MNIPDAVIFSTVVSIMTFILGFVIREWILFYSRNKRLRTTDGFIKWHLNNIVSSLSKQIKGYDILSSCIKSEGYRNWFVEPSLEPKIIIERQESIHTILYYRKKSKTDEREKLFYSIISNCRLIDLIVAETEKLFERMNNEILEHESKLDNIGVLIYQKIVGLQIKEDVNNTEKFIIETYNNFNPAVPKRSLLNDNVIQSIENNLIKTKYEHLLDFVELTSQYQKDFGFYKNSLDQFNLKVIEYRENLNSVYEDLTLTIDNYNNLKYKSNLF